MRKERLLLTPEKAQAFLDKPFPRNRKIQAALVRSYAIDIIEGRWNEDVSEFDGAIAISTKGELMNGQHRCCAVIMEGQPIYVWVYYDVPEEMYDFFDGGSKRKVSDVADVPNSKNASAIATVAYAIKYGKAPLASAIIGKTVGGRPPLSTTKQQALSLLREENDAIQRYIKLGNQAKKYTCRNQISAAIAFYLIDFCERGDTLERFADECGLIVPESKTVIACRTYMSNCLANKNFNSNRKWAVSCFLYAYEAYRDNRDITYFNKTDVVFSKYDKYVFDARNRPFVQDAVKMNDLWRNGTALTNKMRI